MSVIETVASARRKTKESVRIEGMIPLELREDSALLITMMDAYYDFMNLFGHSYNLAAQTYYATVVNNHVIFKADANDYFYSTNNTFTLYDNNGVEISMPATNYVGGTDDLPDALTTPLVTYGVLFNINHDDLIGYELKQLKLVTNVIRYVGDNPTHAIDTLLEERDIDTIQNSYLKFIQKEIAATIPRELQTDKKLLYKNITQFYRERGSEESIAVFFKILIGDNVEIKYPANDMLIPSDGRWDQDASSYKETFNAEGVVDGSEFTSGKFIDNSGFLSDYKKLQDSFFYQKFSYLIRTGTNVSYWENAFNKLIHPAGFKFFGEILILIYLQQRNSMMPLLQPGLIGAEDLVHKIHKFISLSNANFAIQIHRSAQVGTTILSGTNVSYIEIEDLGLGYTVAPIIAVTGDGTGAAAVVTLNSRGQIIPSGVTAAGVAYISMATAGAGYTTTNTTTSITTNALTGQIKSVDVSSGYKYPSNVTPTITFSPSGITGATLATGNAVLDSSRRLSGINITNGGSGYTRVLDPIITITGRVDRVAEFFFELELEIKNSRSYKERRSENWVDLLHFYDTTALHAYEDLTFEELETNEDTVIKSNVSTELFSYDSGTNAFFGHTYDGTLLSDIELKLTNEL